MQAAPAACFYRQISVIEVSYMKHGTQELIPSKGSPRAMAGSHTGQLGCFVTFLPLLEPPDLDSFPSESCFAEWLHLNAKKGSVQLSIRPILPSQGYFLRCSLVPCPFLYLMPRICITADICSRGKALGPLLQWHAGSMLQSPQGSEPVQPVQRMLNGDSLL